MYLFGDYDDDMDHFGLEHKSCLGYSSLSLEQKQHYIYNLLEAEGKGREKEFFPEEYMETQERRKKFEEAQDTFEDWLATLPFEERMKVMGPLMEREVEKTRTLKK